MKYKDYIGVFDSGVGGISVLKELLNIMPNENYIFYGDTLNSPYGDKTKEQIVDLSMKIVKYLVDNGVKAIVIACNTATSAAAKEIREKYPNITIIGIEPAIKPALEQHPNEDILVMATEATIKLEKFNELRNRLDKQGRLVPIPCKGLADAIEKEQDVTELLNKYLSSYKNKVSAVVLGCTHYPFIKEEIKKVLGDVEFYDGAHGATLNLKKHLEVKKQINTSNEHGKVIFESSNNTQDTYKKFLNKI